jgi:hypothetical protein
MIKLGLFKKNDKFTWNGKNYTVYAQEGQMTEIWGNGRFWAWGSHCLVQKLEYR